MKKKCGSNLHKLIEHFLLLFDQLPGTRPDNSNYYNT